MKYKYLTPVFILAVLLCFVSYSQLQARDFEQWRQRRQQRFEAFREERDRRFHEFLKQRWEQMEVVRARAEDTAPKIIEPPSVEQEDVEVESRERGVEEDVRAVPVGADPEPPEHEEKVLEPEVRERREKVGVQLDYFGHNLQFSADSSKWRTIELSSVDGDGIAEFWKEFSALNSDALLEQLEDIQEELNLDDWGYLILTDKLARELSAGESEAKLISWGLMLKSDYRVRCGYEPDGRVFLLFHNPGRLYQLPFFNMDGRRFYLYDPPSSPLKSLQTYSNEYEGAVTAVEIELDKNPAASRSWTEIKLTFDYRGREYSIPASYSEEVVDYFKTLPQLELARYFEIRSAAGVGSEMLNELSVKIEDMSRPEAVDFLLAFVQKGFDYKTDQDQFGREKYMLPAEILYFPYSDCDDRAIVFSWLVRRLLEKRVFGLDYPGHVATAVEYFETPPGSYFKVGESPFVVADPTYINATAGMEMPQFSGINPSLLP